ncbi:MAG: DNA-directed RNA polymerase [Christensenellales bacterium]
MQEFTGLVYLLIDIANNYGLDKKSWRERIQWTREHMDELESHLKEAEEPALYYASVKALRQAQNNEQVTLSNFFRCYSIRCSNSILFIAR